MRTSANRPGMFVKDVTMLVASSVHFCWCRSNRDQENERDLLLFLFVDVSMLTEKEIVCIATSADDFFCRLHQASSHRLKLSLSRAQSMALKRIFSHRGHGHGHGRSHAVPEESQPATPMISLVDRQTLPAENANEHCDIVPAMVEPSSPDYAIEQQLPHRARRRSSVQILDKKFLQTLANQSTSAFASDDDETHPSMRPFEGACECNQANFSSYRC